MTWNLQNLGKSKSTAEIEIIAKVISQTDVVAIQEVVTNPSGIQTIAKIQQTLNNTTGVKWDYTVSDPTNSSPYRSERYAYIWKTNKVKLKKKAFLDPTFQQEIEREPYIATFSYKNNVFTLSNFHALPKKHQPEKEIKYFKFLPDLYPDMNLIFLGDFNTPQYNNVFNPLKKQGYTPAFTDQKTSLKQKCINGDCLASEYDNIFIPLYLFDIIETKAIYFFENLENIQMARKISDHIPLLVKIQFKEQ
ncbi:endonuclease [Myroides pelagicus]|uniref:Endonuclease n=2 Tax=Myroides pelagicus TaxID=270914 RepID=A0A7K1GLA8_9FLAO|nr:endonuclease/exonuclease/phosphatase family protein [Myroides pelagicus]MEC4112983.1 endonuclease/exonuclease/phosphatase family protein [Myroides pelagicus]MTH29014.1 endonuclease [Myroides pelagicus]